MRIRTRSTSRALGAALTCSALVAMTACGGGGGDAFDDPDAGVDPTTSEDPGEEETSASGGASGEITVGGANFTEMLVMQEMYAALLEDAGFTVDIISVENREAYAASLESGEIDVVPEYAATMAEFLNIAANGDAAEPVASSDVDETVAALTELAEPLGLAVLEPAEATDQNAFAVTEEFATTNDLVTLSDLGALGEPIVLAATPECPERPFCEPGLEEVYGIDVAEVLPLGFGSLETKASVESGESQLGLVGTTDGTLEQFGLVVLEDDQGLQNAENLVPMVNAETLAEHPEIADVLNQLNSVLTTDVLAGLNLQVDAERMQASVVAQEFLESEGLIG